MERRRRGEWGGEGGGGGQTGSSSRWSGRDILRRKYCANRTGCDRTCSLARAPLPALPRRWIYECRYKLHRGVLEAGRRSPVRKRTGRLLGSAGERCSFRLPWRLARLLHCVFCLVLSRYLTFISSSPTFHSFAGGWRGLTVVFSL